MLLRCAAGVAVLFLAVWGYVCFERTLIVWWLPVAVAGSAALAAMPFAGDRWRWLIGSRDAVCNRLCHLCVVGAVVYAGFMSGNFLPAGEDSEYKESVLVERKAKEQRKEYRRVNRRNHLVRVHDVWCLYVRFDNGMRKRIEVPLGRYRQARETERVTVSMRRGRFGYPVIVSVATAGKGFSQRPESAS